MNVIGCLDRPCDVKHCGNKASFISKLPWGSQVTSLNFEYERS